jgi:hypothetical protein
MERLDFLTVHRPGGEPGRIELYKGDLTDLKPAEAVDVLGVSAFRNDYTPVPPTLIHALAEKGLAVWKLSQDKEVDLRDAFSCWLSRELPAELAEHGLRYRRILCFEPHWKAYWGNPPQVVEELYQALAPFMGGKRALTTVAMPLLATGNIGCSIQEMIRPLLDAPLRWMRAGFPLRTVRIACFSADAAEIARREFQQFKSNFSRWDVFISYCHEDSVAVDLFCQALREARPELAIFRDRNVLQAGDALYERLANEIRCSSFFVPFYSPDYLKSNACLHEFSTAWVTHQLTGRPHFFPILARAVALTPYMMQVLYEDCTAGKDRLLETCCRLVERLRGGGE